jgi:uncharacterized protein YndB with AHSA1/START domain
MDAIPDRIEKQILLNAPLERVWHAISDASQFGRWFGARFDGPFRAGQPAIGSIQPTEVDPEVAKLQAPHAGKKMEFQVERIEPMRLFAIRWHPFAIDPSVDYGAEPTTLIEFRLEPQGAKTLLTLTESGFDSIPLARRAAAFRANDGGWAHQCQLLAKFLAMIAAG